MEDIFVISTLRHHRFLEPTDTVQSAIKQPWRIRDGVPKHTGKETRDHQEDSSAPAGMRKGKEREFGEDSVGVS